MGLLSVVLDLLFIYLCVCCEPECRCPLKLDGIRSLGPAGTSGCDLPGVGSGNWSFLSSQHSLTLNHLPRPELCDCGEGECWDLERLH